MAEFWIGVAGVAMGLLGAVISLHPPKDKQWKILSWSLLVCSV